MKTSTRNRLIALAAVLVAGGALGFIAFGNIGKNLVYYWTPGEMLAKGEGAYRTTIRLGGMVQRGSLQWDPKHTRLSFRVADGPQPGATSVLVSSSEVPPQMFREGIGVVVEGTYDRSGLFTSHRLMVNHSNEYRPPKPGDTQHEDWKKTVSEAESTTARKP
jgi:cytochrome c-type biogenesis protein CcmE